MAKEKGMVLKNYAGTYQLRIETPEDLSYLSELDETFWVATSAPADGFNCDPAFIRYLDADQDGRIRIDEVRSAQGWLLRVLRNRESLGQQSDVLRLEDIDTSEREGKELKEVADYILATLSSTEKDKISLSQVREVQSIIIGSARNGDGVIPPDVSDEEEISQFIADVIKVTSGTPDLSGKSGITEVHLDTFLKETRLWLEWKTRGQTLSVPPWGSDIDGIYQTISEIEDKVNQFFHQCNLVSLDSRVMEGIQLNEEELKRIDFSNSVQMEKQMEEAPLSPPRADGLLPLDDRINPYYADKMGALKEKVLKVLWGESVYRLTGEDWKTVLSTVQPYREWLEQKPETKVELLGEETLRKYTDTRFKNKVIELIAEDKAVAEKIQKIQDVEKLILFQKWLMPLANSFVSFPSLYNPSARALFQMGVLVMDGRAFTFSIKVRDVAAHKGVAINSHMFVMYAEISGRKQDEKFTVACPVTAGTRGGIRVGKRGVFFTVNGQVRDARVVDIIENPISAWEAVSLPFKRLFSWAKSQTEKFADKHIAKLSQPSASSSMLRDILLGGGIAIAALGSSFAFILKTVASIKFLHVMVAILLVAGTVVILSFIMAVITLKQRDMSVILEASGWAVNTEMRLTSGLGALFTRIPGFPEGAKKERGDLVRKFARQLRIK